MYSWIMLALAVLAEVASTLGMKYAVNNSPMLGYLFMAVMISISIYFFSKAVVKLSLAVSYAVWEGAGLLLIALAGMLIFNEYLDIAQLLAMAVMLFGLLLVTFDKGEKALAADTARATDTLKEMKL